MLIDREQIFLRLMALLPGCERDEEECVVRCADSTQETESDHRRGILNAGRLLQDGLDLLADRIRTLKRCRGRQLDVQKQVALVFHRQKSAGQFRTEPT